MSAIRYSGTSIVAPSKNQWRPNTDGGSGEPLRLEATSGITATVSQTLGAVTLVSAATNAATSSLALTIGSVTLTAAAKVATRADLAGTLGAVTLAGDADVTIAAALAQTLGAITLSGQSIGGRVADFAQALGNVGLSANATVSQPAPAEETPAPSATRGGIVFKRARKKPSFIGVPDVPYRQPQKAPARRASLRITLGRIGCSADASLGIHPAALSRRRRVAVALLLS